MPLSGSHSDEFRPLSPFSLRWQVGSVTSSPVSTPSRRLLEGAKTRHRQGMPGTSVRAPHLLASGVRGAEVRTQRDRGCPKLTPPEKAPGDEVCTGGEVSWRVATRRAQRVQRAPGCAQIQSDTWATSWRSASPGYPGVRIQAGKAELPLSGG